jgi:predicted nucleic acid-binding protein
LIRPLTVTWSNADDCDRALSTFQQHRLRNSIGILDALIGESTVGSNATLCTHNSRHFALITGLILEHPHGKKP